MAVKMAMLNHGKEYESEHVVVYSNKNIVKHLVQAMIRLIIVVIHFFKFQLKYFV